jgi:hypothetical protein
MDRIRLDVSVQWRSLKEDDEDLDLTGCLYALLDRDTREICYIGKASRASVAERLQCRSKDAVWERLAKVGNEGCYVLLGELTLHTYWRLTDALLSDVESLLIMAEQPTGNKQSKLSRIDRQGLSVECSGRWPGRATHYIDGEARKRRVA